MIAPMTDQPAHDEQRYGEWVAVRRHGAHGHVAELVLDRVKAMNAISTEMARNLHAACAALSGDDGVRVVVLTSSHERAFCVGADLKERESFTASDFLRQRPVTRSAYTGVLELPMPTVAAVHGFALGGGFELALSCDLIVADETAVFGLPETTVGLVPGGGGTQLTLRRLGPGRAADLVLTGRHVPAAEAAQIGLADRVVPAGQAEVVAVELAMQIAANSPVAVRAAKQAIRLGAGVSLAAGLELEDAAWRTAVGSADRQEGITAFTEHRKPRWQGR